MNQLTRPPAIIIAQRIKVMAVVRYRAGQAIDKFETVNRNRGLNVLCARPTDGAQWIAPQVVAVQLDEVEGVEEYALVSAVVPDEIERGNAVLIAGDSFTVDDAGARAQACQRLDNQREAAGNRANSQSRVQVQPST